MADQPRSNSPPRKSPAAQGDTHPPPHATPSGSGGSMPLMPNAEPVPGYRLVSLLGRGGFGEVWKATGPGGFEVAMKFVKLGERVGDAELKALEVMKGIRHPHLLSVFGAWQNDGRLIVAMELGDRTLLDRLVEVQKQGKPGIPEAEVLATWKRRPRASII